MSHVDPNRRKPPKPGDQPQRKRSKGILPISKRQTKIKAETTDERGAFVASVGQCMIEGCPDPPQEYPHEITCGNGRESALYMPRMQMAVCARHHRAFHSEAVWTKKRQLAARVRWELKQFAAEFCDNLGFDRGWFTVDDLIDYLIFTKPPKEPKRKRGSK